jgi:hypothetical protein
VTLLEIIAAHEAARPIQMQPALTPKGAAVLAVYRLRHQLAQLSAEDAEEIGPMLTDLVVTAARRATA